MLRPALFFGEFAVPNEKKPISELERLRAYFYENETMKVLSNGILSGKNDTTAKDLYRTLDLDQSFGPCISSNNLFDESIIQNNTCVYVNIASKIPNFRAVRRNFFLRQQQQPQQQQQQEELGPLRHCFWFSAMSCAVPKLVGSVHHRNKIITKSLLEKGYVPSFEINFFKRNNAGVDDFGSLFIEPNDIMYPTYDKFSPDIDFLLDCDYTFDNLNLQDLHNFMALLEKNVLSRFLQIVDKSKFSLNDWVDMVENLLSKSFFNPIPLKSTADQILFEIFNAKHYDQDLVVKSHNQAILFGETKIRPTVIKSYILPIQKKIFQNRDLKQGLFKSILKPTSISMQIFSATAY
jgi:hypothetical protein